MNISAGELTENLLATVVHASETPVLILDRAGRVSYVNPAFEACIGSSQKLRAGSPLTRILTDKDTEAFLAFVASNTDGTALAEVSLLVKIGKPSNRKRFEIRAATDSTGGLIGFRCLLDTLLGSQPTAGSINYESWRVALESANQAIWEARDSTRELWVTESWFHLRGLDPQRDADVIHHWRDMVHPDDLKMLLADQERQSSSHENLVSHQYRYRHADGHWVWVLSRGRILTRDEFGRPDRLVGTDTDVTEMVTKQAQNNILANRLQLSLEVSGVGIWEYDIDEGVAHWDARVRAIYGIDDELETRPNAEWDTYIHPDDRDRVVAIADACFAEKRNFSKDYRIVRPNGEIRHVRSRAKYVHASSGSGPRFIGVNIDITDDVLKTEELETARAAMEHDSRHDALTGLANRRRLDEVHADFIKTARMIGQTPDYAILNVDLDHFKQTNDTHGHNVGDAVLNYAARLLREEIAESGLVARIGGDEFVVFLPGPFTQRPPEQIVLGILERSRRPCVIDGILCNFGMSIGVANHRDIGREVINVFVAADLALYQAKQKGRGCVRHYKPTMSPSAIAQRFMPDDILTGLKRDQFYCRYRPQFCAKSRDIVGVVALLRWRHPIHNDLDFSQFAAAIEAAGQSSIMHDFVMKRIHADQASWAADGYTAPRISIKIPGSLISDRGFKSSLGKDGSPQPNISFELPEASVDGANRKALHRNLKACRLHGIQIEIGDFGSGKSSVLGILKIAPNRIKIDPLMIASATKSKSQRKFVEALVRLAKMAGAEVIAKGIDTKQKAKVAAKIGCDILQGPYFGEPLSVPELRELFRAK